MNKFSKVSCAQKIITIIVSLFLLNSNSLLADSANTNSEIPSLSEFKSVSVSQNSRKGGKHSAKPPSNPPKDPVCKITGPYHEQCQGYKTLIPLDGSTSFDPEGFELQYEWIVSCEKQEPLLSGENSAIALLNLATPGIGFAENCEVQLTVTDIEGNSTSCKTEVSSTACELDCNATPNGTQQYDLCGVCGGNNECLDCADVPNGKKILDNSVSQLCCLESEMDACGVCFGDGFSCVSGLECVAYSLHGEKEILDSAYTKIQKIIRRARRHAAVSCKGQDSKGYKVARKKASDLLENFANNNFIASLPNSIEVCGSEACTNSAVAVEVNILLSDVGAAVNKVKKLVRAAKTCSGQAKQGKSYVKRARKHSTNLVDTLLNTQDILACW